MDELSGHIFIVEDEAHRGALGHEDHQQGDIAPRVGKEQGGGHGAHGGPAHVDAGAGGLLPAQVRALLHHLVDGGGDVHREVHHRAGCPNEDGGHIDLGQVQMGIASVEEALGVGHDRPVDLEEVREEDPQHTGHQNAQEGARHRGEAALVKAVDQGDDDDREEEGDGQPHPDGIPPLEVEGDQHLPEGEDGEDEGGDGPHAGAPGEEDEEEGEAGGHQGLPAQAVVVGHGDIGDGVPVVAHHHIGPVAHDEELVLLQRAVEHVDAGDHFSLEGAVQDLQGAALLPGADQPGVDDGGIVGLQDPGGAPLGLLVEKGPLKAGGEDQQKEDGQETDQHRGMVAQGLWCERFFHDAGLLFHWKSCGDRNSIPPPSALDGGGGRNQRKGYVPGLRR